MSLGCVVQAAKEILRADDDTVSSLLGGLTLGTGIVGTLGGGAYPFTLLVMAHDAHTVDVYVMYAAVCGSPSSHSAACATYLAECAASQCFLAIFKAESFPDATPVCAGWLLDRVGSSLRNAMMIQGCAAFVATVACILAFMVAGSLPAFAPLLALGLLGVFVVQAPLCKPSSSAFSLKSRAPSIRLVRKGLYDA